MSNSVRVKAFKNHTLRTFKRYERHIQTGFDTLGHITEFTKGPGTLAALRMVFGVTKTLVNGINVAGASSFSCAEWERLPDTMALIAEEVLLSGLFPLSEIGSPPSPSGGKKEATSNTNPKMVSVGGTHFGLEPSRFGYPEVFLPRENVEGALSTLADAYHRYFGRALLITPANVNGWALVRAAKDNTPTFTTDRVVQYSTRFERYLQKGRNRTYLFHGPPGTGKTSLAQSICEHMGLRSIRVRFSDLKQISLPSLSTLVTHLKPQAVLIDDVDRIENSTALLLPVLESLHRDVPFTLLSVNTNKSLDPAVVRCGRVDQAFLIEEPDPAATRSILQERFAYLFDTVRTWPVAFQVELVTRLEVEPETESEAIAELTQRVLDNAATTGTSTTANARTNTPTGAPAKGYAVVVET